MQQTGSDVGLGPFDPWPDCDVHVEQGAAGAALAAERGDIVVVVDVLSFSTTMSIAIERGASVLALSGDDIEQLGGRDVVAAQFDAHIVAKRRDDSTAKFTLSPASMGKVQAGDRLVLTSLNGALMVAAARPAPMLLAGSLRSAAATADEVARCLDDGTAHRVTLVAANEHWTSVVPGTAGIRTALEDQIGVGTIARLLGKRDLQLSVEAQAAALISEHFADDLESTLLASISGRELIEKGFTDDVLLAAEVDAATRAARRGDDGFFV